MRPRENGKVEKANGDIKRPLAREFFADPTIDTKQLLPRVIAIKNHTPGPSGYSLYFLLFGTQSTNQQFTNSAFATYTRDPMEEETRFAQKLVQNHEAPIARSHAAGLEASRDTIRSYTQGKKAQVDAPGDWVYDVYIPRDSITILQTSHIDRILNRFSMQDFSLISTPL
ncbi:hypothetical protein K3495_g76 [Podosphaera aphanis]|nr:hypothetical protein K3495_g76 [Podosphaera aphanis]